MSIPPLTIQDLCVEYPDGTWAIRGVSLELQAGQCLALVGESGCGKTTIARAVLGLLPQGSRITGSIRVGETEIVGAPESALRALRGHTMGFVSQNPFAALNPLMRVAQNVEESWRAHGSRPPQGAVARALAALGINAPERRGRLYPYEWSGGMLQRATIASAAAHKPPLLVADEPTSALDADLAHSTLDALRATGAALLLVSHDLQLVAAHADHVAVCYAGRVVELGPAVMLKAPRHPYTIALQRSIPRPGAGLPTPLDGSPPNLRHRTDGCSFAGRCDRVGDDCRRGVPPLVGGVACLVAG